jgi:hypothetical protein
MKKKSERKTGGKSIIKKGINYRVIYRLLFIHLLILGVLGFALIIIGILQQNEKIDSRLKGEFWTLSMFGRGGYDLTNTAIIKENCSDENIKAIWDFVFDETADNVNIVSDKDANEICNQTLAYKILDTNIGYLLIINYDEGQGYIEGYAYGVYGNFTQDFLDIVTGTNPYYLRAFIEQYFSALFSKFQYVLGERRIDNVSMADEEYKRTFYDENCSWQYKSDYYGESYYFFNNYGADKDISSAIYTNKTLNILIANEEIDKPINLTQIKNIEDKILNGSKKHYNAIDLNKYFENLGRGKDSNLSFSINPQGVSIEKGEMFPYYHKLDFDTSSILYQEFIANITISNPAWQNGAEITSNNFKIIVYGCLDSDKYDNKYEKGITVTINENKTDYCANERVVSEYYCDYFSGKIRNINLTCVNTSCNNGACVLNKNSNRPPRFLENCTNQELEMNRNLSIYLNKCFQDDDNDNLAFNYANYNLNLSVENAGNKLIFIPDYNWLGEGEVYVYANDSKNESGGVISFKVFNKTTNNPQENLFPPLQNMNIELKIKRFNPEILDVYVFPNDNKTFSIEAENYEIISWYLDGAFVKNGATYDFISSSGNHTIKAEVLNGTRKELKMWKVYIVDDEAIEKPLFEIGPVIFYLIMVVLTIIIFLFVLLLFIQKEKDKKGL